MAAFAICSAVYLRSLLGSCLTSRWKRSACT
jgi:hypothetical protein